MLCDPFVDNDRAVMVLHSESVACVEELLNNDPFVYEKYYQSYNIKEFFEENDDNNALKREIFEEKGLSIYKIKLINCKYSSALF